MKNEHILRDPIWQFIGVVVGLVSIFMAFLALPGSTQGIAIISIIILSIILILAFSRTVTTLSLFATLFAGIGFICLCIVDSLAYYHVSFFAHDFGLVAPGVVYAKSELGLIILIIEHLMILSAFIAFSFACVKKKDFITIIGLIFMYIYFILLIIPDLYIANFVPLRVLFLDLCWPKSFIGTVVTLLGLVGYALLFIHKPKHRSSPGI